MKKNNSACLRAFTFPFSKNIFSKILCKLILGQTLGKIKTKFLNRNLKGVTLPVGWLIFCENYFNFLNVIVLHVVGG
jgi:hypothetical protein